MSNFSQQFNTAIQLKFDLMMGQIFIKHGVASKDDEYLIDGINSEAYVMGLNNFLPRIAAYFEGTPLKKDYLAGHREYQKYLDNLPACGSLDEFNALSAEERSKEWDEFHSLCAQGIADDMYFFDVMMKQWLVGYVGH